MLRRVTFARRVHHIYKKPNYILKQKRDIVKIVNESQKLHLVSKYKNSIKDLQNAAIRRNEEFTQLQVRKLAYTTRFGLWARTNFTILSHLLFLGVGSWIILDTTQFVSAILFGMSALNLQKWLTLLIADAIGYQLSADVSIGKIIPKWTKNTIRITDLKINRDYEYAKQINGAAMDIDISVIDVKLSLSHFLTGGGILSELFISKLTGKLDRTPTIWTEAMEAAHTKREPSDSDFHLGLVKIKDLSLTILQNCPNRPLDLKIFSLKLRRLRQHWLLLDLFDADMGHGKFDNCLFSVENVNVNNTTQTRLNHFKIDGLDFDLVSSSYPKGILSWIKQGFMDIDCFYEVPLYTLDEKALRFDPNLIHKIDYETKFNMDLSLNNINISMPNVTNSDISVTNYAMVQPIVAYFNTNYVKIPLKLLFTLPMDDFRGSWYPGEANLYTAISDASYYDILRLMAEQKQYRRARELIMMGVEGCYRGTKYYVTETWKYLKAHV